MRPKIPQALVERIENEGEEHDSPLYERLGYTSKTHFVVEAVREKLDKEENEGRHWRNQ